MAQPKTFIYGEEVNPNDFQPDKIYIEVKKKGAQITPVFTDVHKPQLVRITVGVTDPHGAKYYRIQNLNP